MRTIAFFNNKGGVGKTSLVYHVAWMLSELGINVLAVDLDPQSNLTSAFLTEDELERVWPEGAGKHPRTMMGAVDRLSDSLGDIEPPEPWACGERISLIPGDLGLSLFEDRLSEAWSQCTDDNPRTAGIGFRTISAFYRIVASVGAKVDADIGLIDVGPNIGALNRSALIACDAVVVPLAADMFSLQGLRNLGPTLRQWRGGWSDRKARATVPKDLPLPSGAMEPLGYVLLNPSVRENRPVKAYGRWAGRIPGVYEAEVLAQAPSGATKPEDDRNCIAMVKHFKSLMPLAQDARKPMFLLKPADGAIGGHAGAVSECYAQFQSLTRALLDRL